MEIFFTMNEKYQDSVVVSKMDLCRAVIMEDFSCFGDLEGYTLDQPKASDLAVIGTAGSSGQNDAKVLAEADLSVIIRDRRGMPVHYSCAATRSFRHPRLEDRLYLASDEAYVYAVETHPEHRGRQLAGLAIAALHRQLVAAGKRYALSHYYEQNNSSRSVFEKLAYVQYGSVFLCLSAQGFSWVALSPRRVFEKPECAHERDVWVYDATMSDYERIQRDLPSLIDRLCGEGKELSLAGAGGDAVCLISCLPSIKNRVQHVYDGNPRKVKSILPGSKLRIQSSKDMGNAWNEAILLTSNAHQDEMFRYAMNTCPRGTKVIRLYPSVSEHDVLG